MMLKRIIILKAAVLVSFRDKSFASAKKISALPNLYFNEDSCASMSLVEVKAKPFAFGADGRPFASSDVFLLNPN